MKKKLLIAGIVFLLVFTLAGCAGQQVPLPEESVLKVSELKDDEALNKICKTLREKEYIPEDGIITSANVIGAEAGYSFAMSVNGSSFTMEIYRFDMDNLNETGKNVIESVKKDGHFNVLGYKDINAEICENENYLLIYPDEKLQEETNKNTKEEILKVINESK